MLIRLGILIAVLWFSASQIGSLVSAVPQAASGCPWPCGGVATAFSGGGGAPAGLGALPTPAEAIHLPRLISGAEPQIRSALP